MSALEGVLSREDHQAIADAYHGDDWSRGLSGRYYFDGGAAEIDAVTGAASVSWASILDLDPEQVVAEGLRLDSRKPSQYGYPVKIDFSVDSFGLPDQVSHEVVLYGTPADDRNDFSSVDRLHTVHLFDTTPLGYLEAVLRVQGYRAGENGLELDGAPVEGGLRRLEYSGPEIVDGSRRLEYIERV